MVEDVVPGYVNAEHLRNDPGITMLGSLERVFCLKSRVVALGSEKALPTIISVLGCQ